MRRCLTYSGISVVVAVAAVTAIWFFAARRPVAAGDKIRAPHRKPGPRGGLTITYPLDETLFPPEIVPPVFRWKDHRGDADAWLVTIDFPDGDQRLSALGAATEWTPSDEQWKVIRSRSLEKTAKVTVLGVRGAA